MASVHLARMDGPGGFQKWVAIKRIHPHLVEDDQFVDMFLDEARIAAGINHANVAQVFDLGKDDNTYWIAMEYLHGEPLREVMRRAEEKGQRISPEIAARVCADAAEGLHAAHELRGKNGQLLGLVHRDVTPHNLFVTYDGYTKVVDFGIAKVADRLASTRAGTLKGKLAYMSPEQVQGKEVDRTTDIFALGVVLWELTTNQRLFRMDTDLDTLEKVQACNVPPPSTIVRGYPQELEAVVLKALAKRKQDRYQTAREFSRALQGYLMRSGAFVGPEEVAQFVRGVFTDRIAKREAHLAWAAEVTSTVNVDQLRAQGKGGVADEISLLDDDEDDRPGSRSAPSKSAAQPIAGKPQAAAPARDAVESPSQQMAAASLMDDDEDVPTTVATREHMEKSGGPLPSMQAHARPGGAPLPAAGMPAAGMPAYGQQAAAPRGGHVIQDERTAALPSGGGFPGGPGDADDLNATIALPNAQLPRIPDPGPPKPTFGPQPGFGGGFPAQAPSFNGQGMPQQPSFGPAPQPGAFAPQPQVMPQPGMFQNPNAPMMGGATPGPRGVQSQIETAMSLPRPDPAALWMAQQEAAAQHAPRKNAIVLVLVVALVAICVIGIGVLVYFKMKTQPTAPVASAVPEATLAPSAAALPPPAATPAPAPAPTEAAQAPAEQAAAPAQNAAAAAPGAGATRTAATTPSAASTAAAAATAAPAAGGGDPGFLTIVCNPFCDDVLDNGKSLGPSPIVHLSVKPGQHRVTLKKGTMNKVISVIVVSGQVTAQRVSMK
jgi:serine/threonine-protein kinase